MDVRYFIDPDTDEAHIYGHGVTEAEVEFVLRHPVEDLAARDGARQALGQTAAGRYLRVIYVPDPGPAGLRSAPAAWARDCTFLEPITCLHNSCPWRECSFSSP